VRPPGRHGDRRSSPVPDRPRHQTGRIVQQEILAAPDPDQSRSRAVTTRSPSPRGRTPAFRPPRNQAPGATSIVTADRARTIEQDRLPAQTIPPPHRLRPTPTSGSATRTVRQRSVEPLRRLRSDRQPRAFATEIELSADPARDPARRIDHRRANQPGDSARGSVLSGTQPGAAGPIPSRHPAVSPRRQFTGGSLQSVRQRDASYSASSKSPPPGQHTSPDHHTIVCASSWRNRKYCSPGEWPFPRVPQHGSPGRYP